MSVGGADPGMLEVRNARSLIGKHVTITPDRFALWTIYTGHIGAVSVTNGPLEDETAIPEDVRSANDFPEVHHKAKFYLLGLDKCAADGKTLTRCPVIRFMQDLETNTVGMVTIPWVIARLRRDPGS